MTYYYQSIERLSYGFENPNHAAALLAMLSPLIWLFSYRYRWGLYISLSLFILAGFLIITTFSRGGIIAFTIGNFLTLLSRHFRWSRSSIIGLAAAIISLGSFSYHLKATSRYRDSWHGDRSVINRLVLWKTVPSMISSAPQGWGQGKGHIAYMEWFQPLSHNERFQNLVNLHLRIIIENGLLIKFLYALAWTASLASLIPYRSNAFRAIACGSLASFFVSSMFTDYQGAMFICTVPAVISSAGIAMQINTGRRLRTLAAPALTLSTLFILSITCGKAILDKKPILSTRGVHLGKTQESETWIFSDQATMGKKPGRVFRTFIDQKSHSLNVAFVESLAIIPREKTIVIGSLSSEKQIEELEHRDPKSLILFNPTCAPEDLISKVSDAPLTVIFGEYAETKNRNAWESLTEVVIAKGCGNYIPNWPSYLSENFSPKP